MSAEPHRFPGFSPGAHATAIPNGFFADLLPRITDPAELVVTLYTFFALGRRRASERWLTREQLAAELPLRRALAGLAPEPEGALERGLAAAVERGTLVAALREGTMRYTVNSPAGRRGLALPQRTSNTDAPLSPAAEDAPTIYALYEETVGSISPLVADELRAAEEEYPPSWIEEAFREAAAHNRRSWRYVQRILERWRDEGRHDAAVGRDPGARRDLAGRYRGLIRR